MSGRGEGQEQATPTRAALDLGRNRIHLATIGPLGHRVVPLDGARNGLVVRWRNERGCDRLTDRIMEAAHTDHGRQIVDGLACLISPALAGTPIDRVAVPTAMGPRSRAIVAEGLRPIATAGLVVVDRPAAALADWLATRRRLGGFVPDGLVLGIDNDGGELSVVAADLSRQRLLAVTPLSVGPGDDVRSTVDRLRHFASRTVGSTVWAEVSAAFELIVVSGSGADHPDFVAMIGELFPATARAGAETPPSEAVVNGLGQLEAVSDMVCAWPTASIWSGDLVVRPAGPHRATDEQAVVVSADQPIGLDAVILGRPEPRLDIPPSIGPLPRMRLLADGRLEFSGGTPAPHVVDTSWPLLPRRSGVGPEAIGHVEPQLGRHS